MSPIVVSTGAMATTTPTNGESISEECLECESTTAHDVSVQILTESADSDNAAYSREPYRVSVCQSCGTEERIRMNNA